MDHLIGRVVIWVIAAQGSEPILGRKNEVSKSPRPWLRSDSSHEAEGIIRRDIVDRPDPVLQLGAIGLHMAGLPTLEARSLVHVDQRRGAF